MAHIEYPFTRCRGIEGMRKGYHLNRSRGSGRKLFHTLSSFMNTDQGSIDIIYIPAILLSSSVSSGPGYIYIY